MNWREHPRLTMAGGAILLVALLFVVARGCGCAWTGAPPAPRPASTAATTQPNKPGAKDSSVPQATPGKRVIVVDGEPVVIDESPKPAATAAPSQPAAKTPTQPAATSAKADTPIGDANDDAPSPTGSIKTAARPKDVARWRRDDYYDAKRENDPRLTEAVAWLGEHFVGKTSAAELLIRLLDSRADDPFSENASSKPSSQPPKLVEAIIAALAANGSPLATRALEQLAAEDGNNGNDPIATAAALKALARRPGSQGEESLFRIITSTQPAATGRNSESVSPELRATAIGLLKTDASESLRLRLARHAVQTNTPLPVFTLVWESLKEVRPENLAAQVVFYQSNRLDRRAADSLESQLATQSETALEQLLGLPSQSDRPAPSDDAAPVTIAPDRAAAQLWSPAVADAAAARLRMTDRLAQAERLVRLATSIPSQSMRIALLQTLERHWEEGPHAFDGMIAADAAPPWPIEPGFLLVAKKLPRKDPPPSNRPSKAIKGAIPDSKRRQDELAQQWMAFSESLVRSLCQRFGAAMTPSSTPKNVQTDLTVKPSPSAEIVGVFRLDWPTNLPASLATTVSPLRVRYVRLDQKSRPNRLSAYYRGQLPNAAEHIGPNGYWIESLTVDKPRAAIRSADVLITKRNKDVPLVPNEDQQLTIEILIIEAERESAQP